MEGPEFSIFNVYNTKLQEKAVKENPTLTFPLTDDLSVDFRRSGPSSSRGGYDLSLVSTKNNVLTYNHLVTSDGDFIPSKADIDDIHVLGMQELLVSTSEGVEPFGYAEVMGTFNRVNGAKRYLFIAMRCNYGFVSGVTQNDTQITVRMINASNAQHTLNSNILVVAYK